MQRQLREQGEGDDGTNSMPCAPEHRGEGRGESADCSQPGETREATASSGMCGEGGDDQRNAEHRSPGSREVVPDSLHGAQSRPDHVAIHGPLGFTRVQGPRIPARR